MSIKSIKIKNLLSFDELVIDNIENINCIVGKNNTGKSNLLKLIRFFYNKLENKRELPPSLNSNYSSYGSITIIYDTSRMYRIVTSQTNKGKSDFFKHIYNTLFKEGQKDTYELTLQINSNDSIQWSKSKQDLLYIISYLYPFFEVETRHINLYDWDKLWLIVSRLKSFNIKNIKDDEIVDFFDEKISQDSNAYKEYISTIQNITKTGQYSYREKVLNFVKAGLKGQTFLINDKSLETQSDGTNSHKFIEIALELLISLSRRDYISPTVYIDEPEIGLHPKKSEELIYKLYDVYNSYEKTTKEKKKGKYKTPYPKIIFSTHSPNIVKEVIKLFDTKQQILHFSKNDKDITKVQKMNSIYEDKRFLNIFSDNEARLFFSSFILFVEGETELEIFGNKKLIQKFPILKKIDIYKSSSNVLGANVNPNYVNTAIPYLFLFDADKIYSFEIDKVDKTKKRIKLENKNEKLYILPDGKEKSDNEFGKLILKYQLGFNKKFANEVNILKKIQNISKETYRFNSKSFTITESIKYIQQLNYLKTYLNQKNVFFVHTTIEEVLIHKKNEHLFFEWLESYYNLNIDEFLYNIRKVTYKTSTYKKRIGIGKISYHKYKILNKTIIYKNLKYPIEVLEFLIDYLRVFYFGGKFELLTNNINDRTYEFKKSFKKKQINEFEKMKISIYKKLKTFGFDKEKQKKQLGKIFDTYIPTSNLTDINNEEITDAINKFPLSIQNKTSGWTTNFLNFAIDKIENDIKEMDRKKRNEEFRKIFKNNFEELYDIITTIEKKL